MSRVRDTSGYRWSVASRALAATVGGYGLASLLAAALALILPMPRLEAVMTSVMVSLLAYAAIIMAVFHARSSMRAWMWLAGASVLLGPLVWLLLRDSAA